MNKILRLQLSLRIIAAEIILMFFCVLMHVNEFALALFQILLLVFHLVAVGKRFFGLYGRAFRLPFFVALACIVFHLLDGAFLEMAPRFFADVLSMTWGGIWLIKNRFHRLRFRELLLLLFSPIALLFLPLVLINWVIPLSLVPAILCVYWFQISTRKTAVVIASVSLFAGFSFLVLPGMFHWQQSKLYRSSSTDKRLNLPVITSVLDATTLSQIGRGKVIVLDLWYKQCGVCFRKFPELEAFSDAHKKDTSIFIAALNIPTETERSSLQSFDDLAPFHYRFQKLQAIACTEVNEWGVVAGYPTLMIFDKKGSLRYMGDANFSRVVPVRNLYQLVKRLAQE